MVTKQLLDSVWNKGRIIDGYDPNIIRKDACGAWIVRDKYAVLDNPYCWVIDHILPKSMGGDDNLTNLRPLHLRNQISKGDNYPSYISTTTSSGKENIKRIAVLKVNSELQRQLDALYSVGK